MTLDFDTLRTAVFSNGGAVVRTHDGREFVVTNFWDFACCGAYVGTEVNAKIGRNDAVELLRILPRDDAQVVAVFARYDAANKAAEAEWDLIDTEGAAMKKLVAGEVATFTYSGDAYDRCQTTIEANGVILDCGDVIGLSDAWPVAVTANLGKLHGIAGASHISEHFPADAVRAAIALARSKGLEIDAAFLAWERDNTPPEDGSKVQGMDAQADLFLAHDALATTDVVDNLTAAVRGNREAWLNRFAKAARPVFAKAGYPLPENIRISVGFPSTGLRSNRIGECWAQECSQDGHFEIFIHPTLGEASRVADILTHELIHAAVGLADGHGKLFGHCARKLGLEGKLTATTAGAAWHTWADPILARLGVLPHASLAGGASNAPKKQGTRMIKAECDACGFTFRTTRKWLEGKETLRCPDTECEGRVCFELPSEDEVEEEG